jgi:hypothetical protein
MTTMSSTPTTSGSHDKTVIGYPAQSSQVAAGYPAAPTAYPYAVKPPSYTRLYQRRVGPTGSRSVSSFFCRLIMAAAALFAILGVVFFITWLVLKPQLPEFRVDSASVSPLNLTGSELTATWNLTLLVRNPNTKLRIYYESVEASLVYGNGPDGLLLGTTTLAPFFQGKKNETRIRVGLSVVGEYVGEDVVTKISGERARGSVGFGVRVFAWVRFRTGSWWRSRQCLLRVYCDQVQIGFGANNGSGSLTGQPGACEVDL